MYPYTKSTHSGAHLRLFASVLFALAISVAGCAGPKTGLDHGAFTIVMLPDTQIYSKAYPDLFYAQTRWIRANRDRENIKCVTHVGDIVNDCVKDPEQWDVADKAMAVLDGVVPYGVAIGNHDYEGRSSAVAFVKYFGPDRYKGRPWYRGASENKLSSCQLFSGGGVDFVILHLEIDVPDPTIEWAIDVLRMYPDRAAIVSTHAYLKGRDGVARNTKPAYDKRGNSGEEVWDKLIRRNPQIFMVLCGHEGRTEEYHQISKNDAGNRVVEMLADYQKRSNGGEGWLRLIRFVPSSRQIQVRTYSPALGQFETDSNSQFTVPWDLPDMCRRNSRLPLAVGG
ncbi:MAG TPA: metallophosphoesterase [Phycisphaerae bacterium]|nr:metallophosphoesterase [Phycisphaerae bacterium]HRR87681.1 metallophosphoesterase [Phycisphaerae bacterium]